MKVATPRRLKISEAEESPSDPQLQINEEVATESPLPTPQPTSSGGTHTTEKLPDSAPPTKISPVAVTTPVTAETMETPPCDFAQDLFGDSRTPRDTQVPSLEPTRFAHQQDSIPQDPDNSTIQDQINLEPQSHIGYPSGTEITPEEIIYSVSTLPSFSITRREVLILSNVLERIPQSFVTGEDTDPEQPLILTVVDDVTPTTLATTSSQEELTASTSAGIVPHRVGEDPVVARGKRRRPKYSLTSSMYKRHPVLKFSATGPLDKNKSPYKWWCRVCRVELSLMSRGSLELISHYRTDSHLIREHRIRMEVPGMPLYDRDEKELLGTALQDAKKKAKDNYPIPPQLDSYRPLVGQESVPDFSMTTSPTEKILSQISILEFGLRHGGNITSLTGMYDELVRLTSSDRLSVQNWSHQRIFVSLNFLLSPHLFPPR